MEGVTGAAFFRLQYKQCFITEQTNSQEAGIQNLERMKDSVCSLPCTQILFMIMFYYQFSYWMVPANDYLMIAFSEDITYFGSTSDTD